MIKIEITDNLDIISIEDSIFYWHVDNPYDIELKNEEDFTNGLTKNEAIEFLSIINLLSIKISSKHQINTLNDINIVCYRNKVGGGGGCGREK